jgi:hypothetical protein
MSASRTDSNRAAFSTQADEEVGFVLVGHVQVAVTNGAIGADRARFDRRFGDQPQGGLIEIDALLSVAYSRRSTNVASKANLPCMWSQYAPNRGSRRSPGVRQDGERRRRLAICPD